MTLNLVTLCSVSIETRFMFPRQREVLQQPFVGLANQSVAETTFCLGTRGRNLKCYNVLVANWTLSFFYCWHPYRLKFKIQSYQAQLMLCI